MAALTQGDTADFQVLRKETQANTMDDVQVKAFFYRVTATCTAGAGLCTPSDPPSSPSAPPSYPPLSPACEDNTIVASLYSPTGDFDNISVVIGDEVDPQAVVTIRTKTLTTCLAAGCHDFGVLGFTSGSLTWYVPSFSGEQRLLQGTGTYGDDTNGDGVVGTVLDRQGAPLDVVRIDDPTVAAQ